MCNEQFGVSSTHFSFVREVLALESRKISPLSWYVFGGFPQSLQANVGIIPPSPSTPFWPGA
jgi:hypothetical protein